MCPNDGAVDHLQAVGNGFGLVQRFKQKIPEARLGPAPELAIDRGPFTKEVWQIPPLHSSARDPEHAVQDQPVILRRTAPLRTGFYNERRKKRPLLIAHQSTDQDTLLQLAS